MTKEEKKFSENVAATGSNAVVGGIAGFFGGVKLIVLSRREGEKRVGKELKKMFKADKKK